jgi:DNA-binding transcriptional regulator YdaS (Cro superfamily)
MDLLEYISDRTRRAQLAADLDKNPDYLWQIATGRRRASIDLAKLIQRKTRGIVRRGTLRPDAWPSAIRKRKAA